MAKKASVEIKILDAAYKLFIQKGFKQTTMDEIAQTLGISKKTLYNYYAGKHQLLAASFELVKTRITAKVEAVLVNKYISFPLKLKSTLTEMATLLGPINPDLFADLRESAPEVWEDLTQFINESAYKRFYKLLQQGVDEGLIDTSVNINLVVMLYAASIQSLMDTEFTKLFPLEMQNGAKLPPSELYEQTIQIIYNGILTEEARNEFANA